MPDETRPPGGDAAGAPTQPPEPAKEGKRKGRGGLLVLLVVVVVAALGGGYWYVKLRGVVSTDDAYIDGDRATVTTRMLGRITALGADEGDTVQAGQLLVQLDDADLQARLAQASAQLELARTSVRLADVAEKKARDDLERARIQLQGKAISQEEYDHKSSAVDEAQAQHQVALARVEAARSGVDVIRQQISDTRVTAPFTGVVAKRWLLPGDVVQPGQPVFTLYDLDHVWVTAVFEETKLRFLPVGTAVDLTVDAYPDHAFRGTVILIGAAAASQFSLIPPSNASGNFTKVTQRVPIRIRVERDPPDGSGDPVRLLPGMSVVVTVHQPEG